MDDYPLYLKLGERFKFPLGVDMDFFLDLT